MQDRAVQAVVESWSGGAGLVPRGPKVVLATRPCTPADVERHTGRRPSGTVPLWCVEVGGRFLRSAGIVYPGGVPFPEELHSQTAVISGEVWLYMDDHGDVVGVHSWPDAVRRPIASMPRDEYPPDTVLHPSSAASRLSFPLPLPASPWEAVAVVCPSEREALVFMTKGAQPDPLNEMLVYEQGGMSLRARTQARPPDVAFFAQRNSPPYRRLPGPGSYAVGREPGRSLGPQTWPWPGELRWWTEGVEYELRGFVPLATLQDAAASLAPTEG